MATFPSITPTYSFSKNTAPRVRTVVFGDGFEQRLSFGINQNPKTYSLEFRVSETESDVIEAFLNSRAFDNQSFNFTPPAEGISKTGTYSRSGSTDTITIANHGVSIGDKVTLDFTTGSGTDGDYIVATSVDQNTFTVVESASGATSEWKLRSFWGYMEFLSQNPSIAKHTYPPTHPVGVWIISYDERSE